MKVVILCSSPEHPVNAYLQRWAEKHRTEHKVSIVRSKLQLEGGDILFLVSCHELLNQQERSAFGATLVLHASDLPDGRGWSPHIWQILAGADHIVVSLLEAADALDSGRIWKKVRLPVPKHALWDEIDHLIFSAEVELMDYALSAAGSVEPVEQSVANGTRYYRRRTPEDSRLDPELPIAQQFDLLRICDPDRYPAFFELHGHRYRLRLEKIDGA